MFFGVPSANPRLKFCYLFSERTSHLFFFLSFFISHSQMLHGKFTPQKRSKMSMSIFHRALKKRDVPLIRHGFFHGFSMFFSMDFPCFPLGFPMFHAINASFLLLSRHGTLQGEAIALGSWRVALHPEAYSAPGEPRGKAEMELFVVGETPQMQIGSGVSTRYILLYIYG